MKKCVFFLIDTESEAVITSKEKKCCVQSSKIMKLCGGFYDFGLNIFHWTKNV